MSVPTQEQLLAVNPMEFGQATQDMTSRYKHKDLRLTYRLVNTDKLKVNMHVLRIKQQKFSADYYQCTEMLQLDSATWLTFQSETPKWQLMGLGTDGVYDRFNVNDPDTEYEFASVHAGISNIIKRYVIYNPSAHALVYAGKNWSSNTYTFNGYVGKDNTSYTATLFFTRADAESVLADANNNTPGAEVVEIFITNNNTDYVSGASLVHCVGNLDAGIKIPFAQVLAALTKAKTDNADVTETWDDNLHSSDQDFTPLFTNSTVVYHPNGTVEFADGTVVHCATYVNATYTEADHVERVDHMYTKTTTHVNRWINHNDSEYNTYGILGLTQVSGMWSRGTTYALPAELTQPLFTVSYKNGSQPVCPELSVQTRADLNNVDATWKCRGRQVLVVDENVHYMYDVNTGLWYDWERMHREFGVDLVFDYMNAEDNVATRYMVSTFTPVWSTMAEAEQELSNLQLRVMFVADGGYTLGVVDASNSRLFKGLPFGEGVFTFTRNMRRDSAILNLNPLTLSTGEAAGFTISFVGQSPMLNAIQPAVFNASDMVEGLQVCCGDYRLKAMLAKWANEPTCEDAEYTPLASAPISTGYATEAPAAAFA